MRKEPENEDVLGREQKQVSTPLNDVASSGSESINSKEECRPPKVGNGVRGQPIYHVEESFPEPQFWREETEAIDPGLSLTKDITDSGSFDIRGDIWASTFGKVLQAVPIAALLIDKSFHIVAANQACSKISVQYESILGASFSSLFLDTSSLERTQPTLEAVFYDRRPRQMETMLQINQDWIWARITFRSIRIKSDRLVLTLIEDLTAEKGRLMLIQSHDRSLKWEMDARRRAEEALRLSESRFTTMYHKLPVMLHAFDCNSIMRSVNARWLEDMGYIREEIVGKPINLFLSETSRETVQALCSDLWNLGEAHDIHCQYVKKDRTIIDVLADFTVMKDLKWGRVSLTSTRFKLTHSR